MELSPNRRTDELSNLVKLEYQSKLILACLKLMRNLNAEGSCSQDILECHVYLGSSSQSNYLCTQNTDLDFAFEMVVEVMLEVK